MKLFFKHISCYALCLLPCFHLALAQNAKIDSLIAQPETFTRDTALVSTLNALARELMYQNPDTSILLSNQALTLSEKLQFKMGAGKSYHNLGVFSYIKGDYIPALDYYSKALALWDTLEKTSDKNLIPRILNSKSGAYGNIGVVYDEQGDYPKALDCYLKALRMNEKLGDKNGTAINLVNIGIVYGEQNDYTKALHYFFKALSINEQLGDKNKIATNLGNIGNACLMQAHNPNLYPVERDSLLNKALGYFLKSVTMSEEFGDKNGMARDLGNIGSVYQQQASVAGTAGRQAGLYKKALRYYLRALRMSEELGIKNGMATQLLRMGEVYFAQKKHIHAYRYLRRSLRLSKEIGALNIVSDNYRQLSELYAHSTLPLIPTPLSNSTIGRRALSVEQMRLHALELYKQHIIYRDSLMNEEKIKKIVQMQMQYEYDKKEIAAKTEQEKKNAAAEAEANRQRLFFWLLATEAITVSVIGIIIARSLKVTRKQKTVIEAQKALVDEKNKQITDSINYAKLIQEAILPVSGEIKQFLPGLFIFFQPKDVVSGDFYWYRKIETQQGNHHHLLAAADCTGHGVPGALMSMIGYSLLNEIVNEKKETQPGSILTLLNKEIRKALPQETTEIKDGMDIALISLEFSVSELQPNNNYGQETPNCKLQYAGANRPLWIVRKKESENNSELIEIKPTRNSIGRFTEAHKVFEQHTITLNPGDTVYIFSDGFADQFGGEKGEKFMIKRLKELLLSIQHETMNRQQKIVYTTIEEWRGSSSQVDDMLVIGLRV